MSTNRCRSCGGPLEHSFCDLGLSPISNAFIADGAKGETFYPLHARYCGTCWLVQLDASPDASEHFHEQYVYFSSFSSSWLEHARRYVETMTRRLQLDRQSRVMELASNDGYLLQYFVGQGIPCLGIEPTANTAAAARAKGIDTREMFFGRATAARIAEEFGKVDLLIGNNVLAHVPDINDFVGGMPLVLEPEGVITLEFPHLQRLIEGNQFDTIYHEHYCYLSLTALLPVLQRAQLKVVDVEHIPTHGGSLRIYVCHANAAQRPAAAVVSTLAGEVRAGLTRHEVYAAFAAGVQAQKRAIASFMLGALSDGKTVAAYGAAAKGNTLLNYCGLRSDWIAFVADKNPAKQNMLLPGTRIPVTAPNRIFIDKPDYVIILPWNLKVEIMAELAGIRQWGGRFVVPIPSVEVLG